MRGMGNMLIHRSCSINEIDKLIATGKIDGKYDLAHEKQSNGQLKEAVCFYTGKFFWLDTRHRNIVVLEKADVSKYIEGEGDYWVSKAAAKSGRWTGARGKEHIYVQELYTPYYNLSEVSHISVPTEVNREYQRAYIDKYVGLGITPILTPFQHPELKYSILEAMTSYIGEDYVAKIDFDYWERMENLGCWSNII